MISIASSRRRKRSSNGISQGLEVRRVRARADADDQPPAGEHVECSQGLCGDDGVAKRRDEDSGGQTDPGRGRGGNGQRSRAVEPATDRGREVDHFGSRAFTHLRLAASEHVQVSRARLGPGGRIGRHAAASPQLLIVIEGSGVVSGADGSEHAIEAGGAAFSGEEHATRTEAGLVAIVVEADALEPSL